MIRYRLQRVETEAAVINLKTQDITSDTQVKINGLNFNSSGLKLVGNLRQQVATLKEQVKHIMKSTNNKILLLTALMMTSLSAFALKDDTNKPINIVSDNQSLDMENSVVTFIDNVVITQGSILIKANKVVITRPPENSGKKTVEAFGSPVTFHQQLDDGKPVDGKANKVHYDLGTEFLTLTGNAELKQLDSKINGERITYDVKNNS